MAAMLACACTPAWPRWARKSASAQQPQPDRLRRREGAAETAQEARDRPSRLLLDAGVVLVGPHGRPHLRDIVPRGPSGPTRALVARGRARRALHLMGALMGALHSMGAAERCT